MEAAGSLLIDLLLEVLSGRRLAEANDPIVCCDIA